MLHIEVSNDDNDNGDTGVTTLDYRPGHVLALEVQDTSEDPSEDTIKNGGWMRGPYTVSRATETSLDILIRLVGGKKSTALANAAPHTPVRLGGTFKVPILEGVVEPVERLVLISTGVGVGPCIGAIEKALLDKSAGGVSFSTPIELFASFRNPTDVVYRDHLDALAKEYPQQFQWTPIITSEMGRLSSSDENLQRVFAVKKEQQPQQQQQQQPSLDDTHYHLIGNGQMVKEWKSGLEKAGVPGERVTIENYFNVKSKADATVIDRIAAAVAERYAVEASS